MLDKYTPIKRELPFPGQTTMAEELEIELEKVTPIRHNST